MSRIIKQSIADISGAPLNTAFSKWGLLYAIDTGSDVVVSVGTASFTTSASAAAVLDSVLNYFVAFPGTDQEHFLVIVQKGGLTPTICMRFDSVSKVGPGNTYSGSLIIASPTATTHTGIDIQLFIAKNYVYDTSCSISLTPTTSINADLHTLATSSIVQAGQDHFAMTFAPDTIYREIVPGNIVRGSGLLSDHYEMTGAITVINAIPLGEDLALMVCHPRFPHALFCPISSLTVDTALSIEFDAIPGPIPYDALRFPVVGTVSLSGVGIATYKIVSYRYSFDAYLPHNVLVNFNF